MQKYIEGTNRHQNDFSALEQQVSTDNAVRLIGAFIDKLDLEKLGFRKIIHKSEGRRPYAPQVLLKLNLYGYLNKIRSLKLHTRTGSIYVVANLLNPLVRGWQTYYCYFIKRDLNDLWRFVNRRLENWCKCSKRMNLYNSRRWLNTLYKLQPGLFAH